jgi:peroxiredoxin
MSRSTDAPFIPDATALENFKDQSGRSLRQLSDEQPCLVVFLRHAGCTFCREAVTDLVRDRERIVASGSRVVLVHMMPESDAAPFFKRYGAGDWSRVSDPEQKLYDAFEIPNGSFAQLLGPKNWWWGAKALFGKGHAVGWPVGNVRRLPGSFLLHHGRVEKAFRGDSSSDRPDYCELAAPSPAPAG